MAPTAKCFVFSLLLSGSYAVDSLRFFIIGDMGGVDYDPYSTYFERRTAEMMGKRADIYSPHFIMEIGDNFYYEGVKSVDDKRFNLTFESVYTAKSLQVPWYLVAGNHDHRGNVTAQIAYSKVSKRWNFPDFYYNLEFPFNDKGETIGFVMIDTVLLCGNTNDDLIEQPAGPIDQNSADKQWQFIQQSLMKSRSKYLFTAGHYPVYSMAEHGPTECLVDTLLPMLDKYQANGHLSGHDHNLQHLRTTNASTGTTLDYFVSGMANFIDPSEAHYNSVPKDSLKYHTGNPTALGGFLYAEVTDSNITMTFISGSGEQLYTTTIFPRKI